tara:strand:+ start:161 stop:466 length:306 start_codon:yes stop_codon:yes gene_type:complete
MLKKILILILFFLPSFLQAKDVREVWESECSYCHTSFQDLAIQNGKKTREYMFKYIFKHTNDMNESFGQILSKKDIYTLANFILIEYYILTLPDKVDIIRL